MKLMDLDGTKSFGGFVVPEGSHFSFVVALPAIPGVAAVDRACPPMSAVMRVKKGDKVLDEYIVSAASLKSCNWLENHHHLHGFIIPQGLDSKFIAGEEYEIEMQFDKEPAPFNGLWLHYLMTTKP